MPGTKEELAAGAMVMKPVGCASAAARSTRPLPGSPTSAAGEDIVWSTWKRVVATMAKEMMQFTKNNIIAQAATAMLEGLAA